MKYHDFIMTDVEDEKRKDEGKMLRLSELKQAKENERAKHYHAIDVMDHCYNTIIRNDAVQDHFDTSTTITGFSCNSDIRNILHTSI